jgi:prepilin-type N-terminal cleavage/methylation domain-containing protein
MDLRPHRRSARGPAGFSLLEVMFAAVILAIAISGAASAMISAMRLDRVNRETTVAMLEARSVLEQLQSLDFEAIYAAYNQSAADDGGVAVPGPNFAVPGLSPDPADADGIVGRVSFPEVQNGATWELREDVVDPELGMPMDFDGDGIDGDDHSGDYALLPIRLQVRWSGVSGPRTTNLVTLLSRRE